MLEEEVLELGNLFAFVLHGQDICKYLTDQLRVIRCVFVELLELGVLLECVGHFLIVLELFCVDGWGFFE